MDQGVTMAVQVLCQLDRDSDTAKGSLTMDVEYCFRESYVKFYDKTSQRSFYLVSRDIQGRRVDAMRCRCDAGRRDRSLEELGGKGRCDPSSKRELAPSRLIHSHSLTLTTSRHTATRAVWNAVLLLTPSIQFNLTRTYGSRQVINDPSPSLSRPAIVYSLPGCGNRSPFAARLIPVTHLASPPALGRPKHRHTHTHPRL